MSDFNFTPQTTEAPRPLIKVRLSHPSEFLYAAVVELRGEHDISTATDVQNALSPIFGNVLIDLSDCEFIDSTIISALIVEFQLRRREGHRLDLLVPPENKTISRSVALSGVGDLMTVHPTRLGQTHSIA